MRRQYTHIPGCGCWSETKQMQLFDIPSIVRVGQARGERNAGFLLGGCCVSRGERNAGFLLGGCCVSATPTHTH